MFYKEIQCETLISRNLETLQYNVIIYISLTDKYIKTKK